MEQAKSLAASWARSFLAAALALYMAGVQDPKTLAMAGVADGFLYPLLCQPCSSWRPFRLRHYSLAV
jgi:hypothetical protein